MAKKPEDRYPSAGDLGRAARAAASGGQATQVERSVATGDAAPNQAMPPPVVSMPAPPTGVASSPAPTAGPSAPAAPPPPPGYMPPPPPPGPPTPPPQWQPTAPGSAPGAGGGKNRTPLIIGAVVAAVLVLGVVAALALSGGGDGGGGSDEPDTTEARDTDTTDTGADTSGDSGSAAEADIRLAVETTLGAVVSDKADVFCGGLSVRYQNQQFGGPFECEEAFKKNDLPAQFTPQEIRIETVEVDGTDATVTLTGGEIFRLVEGENFWEIDGLG
jgi:hypothetical protein